MSGKPETLLLASGLSVGGANSFARQLHLLKRFIEKLGPRVLLAGKKNPGTGSTTLKSGATEESEIFDVREFSGEVLGDLIGLRGISAVILLGYPDQFQFLRSGAGVPVYLWYQCSRRVIPPGLESALVVPLTRMTATHLQNAGFSRFGPVIPHGVDTTVFTPRQSPCTDSGSANAGAAPYSGMNRQTRPAPGNESRGPRLLTVGANTLRKRFDRLIEAFSLVADELPAARLWIKTDAIYKPGGFDLEGLAGRFGVADRLEVIESELTEAALASLYASADLYVHTAEWEGFCIPVIEAMASGLPVITHPVQGPGELVPYTEHLVTGSETVTEGDVELLIADPRCFAEAIIEFAKDSALADTAAKAGRTAATRSYDIRLIAKLWNQLIYP